MNPMSTGRAAGIMLSGFPYAAPDPKRSLCPNCHGKRFDPEHGGGARKCQRCRGMGYTTVGRTKR